MAEVTLPAYLAPLNAEQLTAVRHDGRRLLILAGAGSGKTRVITTKIAYLIKEKALDPAAILAVTFTNKAAREMAERAQRIEPRAAAATLKTFHSFGAWFLRRNGQLLGLDSRFVIYDDDDSTSLITVIAPELSRLQAAQLASRIARAKDYALGPDDPELTAFDSRPEFQALYAAYAAKLTSIGNLDFGDLILKPTELLRRFPAVRERIRQRFRVILVDEYQDSNLAQFQLLEELVGPETKICVVGDDDQSIYRFRGAEVRNILDFPQHFSGTDIIRLERNYRSVAPILRLASAVVDHNQGRLGKSLIAERGDGKQPSLIFLDDQDKEAAFCAELVERSRPAARFSDWAILYRTNAQSLGFETEFLRRRIPYRVVGSLKFYEREEVKDALALMALIVNGRDEVAFKRVVNKPARGLGPASLGKIRREAAAGQPQADLVAAAARVAPSLGKKAQTGLIGFVKMLTAGRRCLSNSEATGIEPSSKSESQSDGLVRGAEGLSVLLAKILENSGLSDYHHRQDEVTGSQKIANLQELANAASQYPATEAGLVEFLEHIELDRSMEQASEAGEAVTLITLHNTKGLEFRRVVITGLEQGIFPREDKQAEDLEEERRLFYVGATRAMDELYLSCCRLRRLYGRTTPMLPSLFISEIPTEDLRVIGAQPTGYSRASWGLDGRSSSSGSFDPDWLPGSRIFHDDFGYGTIASQKTTAESLVIGVRFDNGQQVYFQPRYQANHYLRVKDDD